MKNSYKALLLAALGLSSASAVQASSDMLLGFTDASGPSSAQNDYVIDLGVASQFTTTATINLSSAFNSSTFSSAYSTDASYLNDVAAGVAEGFSGAYPKTIYATYVTPPTGNTVSSSHFNTGVASVGGVAIGEYTTAAGETAQTGWSYLIAPSASPITYPYTGSLGAQFSASPLQNLSSGIITENLYETTKSSSLGNPTAFAEIGTFDINVNTGSITFTGINAVSVPEPTTYGLIAGAGLLVIGMRRQLSRKNA